MKKSVALNLLVVILFMTTLLTSCKPYGKILYQHLSNPELYDEFSMIVKGFEYWDADTKKQGVYTTDIELDESDTVYIVVYCDSRETFINFYGSIADWMTDEMISEEYIYLKVCKENNDALISNNFYGEISSGDNIIVSATHFVSFDKLRTFMCSLKTENKLYLDFDEGLSNIVKMMDAENKK